MVKTTRPAALSDAPALAAVWNDAHPKRPTTAEVFAAHLEVNAPTSGYLLVGSSGYVRFDLSQREGDPAGKYWAYPTLAEAAREKGEVVRALYEGLLEHLRLLGARFVFTMAQEGQRGVLQTLERLGFRETLRSYGTNLDVAAADPSAYGDPEAVLAEAGVRIRTLAELREDPEHAPTLLEKLHALYLETNRDVPEVGHSDTVDLERFAEHLRRDDGLPDAFFVAVHRGDFIGYSELFQGEAGTLRQETTAVLRPYRRRGVALALKLRGLAYAKRVGAARINTGMASNNLPMVALNERLGFVPEPAYVTLVKDVDENVASS